MLSPWLRPNPELARMDAARFSRIDTLLDEALDRPAAVRHAWLRNVCGQDETLFDEVCELLDAIDASEGFLEHEPDHPPAPVDLTGTVLGVWRLLRLLGKGGAGEVWLAERADGRFEQRVAVKLLHHAHTGTTMRLEREQALLARLEHHAIARLIDASTTAHGQPYMVMQYVDGRTLIEHCETFNLSLKERLSLFDQICDAVAFAHRHLVVHCDLKPQNILVGDDGRVALLDFGIARLIGIEENHPDNVQTRSRALTPQYAAPEQLAGTGETTLTDVYALGLILHELLTGSSPWGELVGKGPMAMLQRALVGPPPSPSSVAPTQALSRSLRGDIDAIVSKALRPEPESRYPSVEAMREDLRRYATSQPVRARGDAMLYRLQRGLRRYWIAASLSALVLVTILVGTAGVLRAQKQAERERDIAEIEATRAKAVRDSLAHMFRDAGQRARDGNPITAKQILDQAAARIDGGFDKDPNTAAQVLHALGELHLYINDYAGAEPLLRHWLAREKSINDPDSAADVRFALAEVLYRMGQLDESIDLLHTAQDYWRQSASEHADRLLTSRMLQSQLERQRGDIALGIETLESTVPLRLSRSGELHFETAALFSNLGAAYIQGGRLDEGIAISQRAMKLWKELQLDYGNDALNTLNNLAAAYFQRNELDQSASYFEQALHVRREAYGASAATAALIGNYARVMQRQGEYSKALDLIEEAEPMARAHSGHSSPLTSSLAVTRAELLISLKRATEAGDLLKSIESQTNLPATLELRTLIARTQQLRDTQQVHAARESLRKLQRLMAQHSSHAQLMAAQIDELARSLLQH
jgi:tetratricopeptide (TPR) repeat protein